MESGKVSSTEIQICVEVLNSGWFRTGCPLTAAEWFNCCCSFEYLDFFFPWWEIWHKELEKNSQVCFKLEMKCFSFSLRWNSLWENHWRTAHHHSRRGNHSRRSTAAVSINRSLKRRRVQSYFCRSPPTFTESRQTAGWSPCWACPRTRGLRCTFIRAMLFGSESLELVSSLSFTRAQWMSSLVRGDCFTSDHTHQWCHSVLE